MRCIYRSLLAALLFIMVLSTSGCSRFLQNDRNKEETVTVPTTSTVTTAGAKDAQRKEPGRLSEYGSYASVRIATTAAVRLYINEREDDLVLVVAAQGLNRKGMDVLTGMDMTGMEYSAAVRRTAERMVEKGYASDLNANVEVEAEPGDTGAGMSQLEKEAAAALSAVFQEHGMEAVFNPKERR